MKIIDVWQKNVADLNRLSNWEIAQEGDADVVKDAHYVPNDFTFTFAEKTYNTADMLETAVRSYLLLRGFDGKDVDAIGFGSFPTVTPANMNAVVPETHEYGWNMPLIETSNGGYLYKIVDDMDTYGQVDVIILDNWAMRSINFSFNNDMKWTNFCSYPRDPITNYKGCFSSGRALLSEMFLSDLLVALLICLLLLRCLFRLADAKTVLACFFSALFVRRSVSALEYKAKLFFGSRSSLLFVSSEYPGAWRIGRISAGLAAAFSSELSENSRDMHVLRHFVPFHDIRAAVRDEDRVSRILCITLGIRNVRINRIHELHDLVTPFA